MNDGLSWAKYMSISGSSEDEYDIITLQYTEDGLLSVDENRRGHAAAFGDDIAIECLATEFKREIYVVSDKVSSFFAISRVKFCVPQSHQCKSCEILGIMIGASAWIRWDGGRRELCVLPSSQTKK